MKLEGIRVIDLSLFLPGPYLTLMLADHGAEVIKVEPPGEGDPTRHLGPRDGGETVYFRNLNRGKKSVVVDLKNPQDREALLKLCDTADVFVESFRPAWSSGSASATSSSRAQPAHRLLLDQRVRPAGPVPRAAGARPRGRGAERRAQHHARPGRQARDPGLPLADLLASLHGLAGVLMALLRREKTGKGDFIDIAMHDSMLAGTRTCSGPTLAENRQPVPTHERSTGGSAFYRLYETADGRYLALGGQEPKFVRNLLGALGRLDLAPLCEKPGPHQQPVMQFLESVFPRQDAGGRLAFLSTLDVCYAPVNTLPEALDAAADKLLKDELGRRHLAPPIRFRDEPARPSLREPRLGEHDALKKR